MKYGIIYKITNNVTQMSYIGQTTQSLDSRIKQHQKDARNRHISSVIRKYGISCFTVTELFSCYNQHDLNLFEVFFMDKFNTMHPHGYNHRVGGNQNGKCSDSLREKIRIAKLNKPNYKRRNFRMDDLQKIKISRSLGGDSVVGICSKTGTVKVYETATSTRRDGHNPSNVVSICKKQTNRKKSKGMFFMYYSEYANQSGSLETKESRYAQRLENETDKIGI